MYVYFDNNGVLKEIITERPFRAGDSQRDKIYIYWEGEHTPTAGWVKYRKADGTFTAETSITLTQVNKTLPTDPLQNLKYFSYEHTYTDGGVVKVGYPFYQLTVPSEVLTSAVSEDLIPTSNNMCAANVRFVFNDSSIDNLGVIVFSVETSIGILTDNSISETQYNYLISLLSDFVEEYQLNAVISRVSALESGKVDKEYTDNVALVQQIINSASGLKIKRSLGTNDYNQINFENSALSLYMQEVYNNVFKAAGISIDEEDVVIRKVVDNVITELSVFDDLARNSYIVDNLTTNDATKILSAKQGYVLKALIDTKQDIIDNSHKLDADLVDDTNSTHKFATSVQLTQIGTNQTNIATLTAESGASIDLVLNSSDFKLYAVLKNKAGTTVSTSTVIDLPLESVVVSGSYDAVNKKVVLTLQNGSTIEFSVADLIDGLQPEINIIDIIQPSGGTGAFTPEVYATINEFTMFNWYYEYGSSTNILLRCVNPDEKIYEGRWGDTFGDGEIIVQMDISDTPNGSGNYNYEISVNFGVAETTSNKTTSLSSSSTNTQYPSAKVVYDALNDKVAYVELSPGLNVQSGTITQEQYDLLFNSKEAIIGIKIGIDIKFYKKTRTLGTTAYFEYEVKDVANGNTNVGITHDQIRILDDLSWNFTSVLITRVYTNTQTDTLLSAKENTSNKVTSISSSSTDDEYPSAKCVYDIVGDIETLLSSI